MDAATPLVIPSDVRAAAKLYISHFNFSPIRIGHRSKKPKTADGRLMTEWGDKRITLDQVDAHFGEAPCNVGVLTGLNGLTDIDCDCAEVVALAPVFLQPTGVVFGHESKQASHWFYKATGTVPKSFKFRDPTVKDKDHSVLVEIRGEGLQSVVPPSIHESGEPVEFVVPPTAPAEIDGAGLESMVACLASAALLARHWPAEGSRSDAVMALAGALARGGWDKEQAHTFVKDVYRLLSSTVTPTSDIARFVNHSYELLEQGAEFTGLTRLKELIDPKVVNAVAKWLQISEPKASKGAQKMKRLFDLVESFEFFCNDKGEPYVIFDDDGHTECQRVDSSYFRGFLSDTYYNSHQDSLPPETIKSVLEILATRARKKDPREVFVRFGWKDDKVYLDLCDRAWRVVEIDDQGYRVLDKSPVPFRRDNLMQPLPEPKPGGSIAELFECVNAQSAGDRIGYVSWLLSPFHQHGDLPILSVVGVHGSGKSQTVETLKRLTDDSGVVLSAKPKNEDDLAIAMKNSAVAAFDNLSGLPEWLSDALCRVSSGAGFRKRELYENDQEVAFCERRSIIVNGIDDIATRADLADRAIHVQLEALKKRELERDLESRFQERWASILGALLDVVSHGLKCLGETKADPNIRMADFARWVMACEGALVGLALHVGEHGETYSWRIGSFREFYVQNRQEAVEQNLDDDPFATALIALVDSDHRPLLDFSAQGLLDTLPCPEELKREHQWPVSAKAVGMRMNRIRPSLFAVGIEVERYRDISGKRRFTLQKTKARPPVSQASVMTDAEFKQLMKEAS